METSYIYVIGGDNPPYKVGISKNPHRRLKTLQTGHPDKLKILSLKETEPSKTKLLESVIHHNMKQYRLTGEWFNLDLKTILLEVEYALIRYADDPILHVRVRNKML